MRELSVMPKQHQGIHAYNVNSSAQQGDDDCCIVTTRPGHHDESRHERIIFNVELGICIHGSMKVFTYLSINVYVCV